MSIFVASPETMTLPVRMYHHIAQTIDPLIASISTVLIVMTLPVRMYHHIAQTIDPLIASISTVLIVITVLLMVILDRLYGLDRILVGKG